MRVDQNVPLVQPSARAGANEPFTRAQGPSWTLSNMCVLTVDVKARTMIRPHAAPALTSTAST